ncbi:hypothetical protein MD484_g2728, partial [Candolleomyces efflorescens]
MKITGNAAPGRSSTAKVKKTFGERLGFSGRKDKKQAAPQAKTPDGKVHVPTRRGRRVNPHEKPPGTAPYAPSSVLASESSVSVISSAYEDPEAGAASSIDGVETVPTMTASIAAPALATSGVKSGRDYEQTRDIRIFPADNGRHATRMSSEGETRGRDLGEVERIRLLERQVKELKSTTERDRREIEKQLETVKSQKTTIEALTGDRDLNLLQMSDKEATWTAQRTELERYIRLEKVEVEAERRTTEIRNLRAQHEKELRRRTDAENRAQHLERAWREAQEEAQIERRQSTSLKREYAEMERRLDATTKLLKTRTEELDAAQAFLTTADESSGADFSRMVEQLNNDISHCSILMADAVIEPGAVEDRLEEEALETAFSKLSQFGWTRAQISRLHRDVLMQETILFEALVQNALIACCYRLIMSFSYDNQAVNSYLTDLWTSVAASTDPTIAKNWLSITHSQLKKRDSFDPGQVANTLSAAMCAIGWRATTPGQNDLERRMEEKLAEICRRSLKIKEMATEKILSADVRPFYYGPGTSYSPAEMDDVYDSGKSTDRATSGQPILCSTGLGVIYRAVTHTQSSGRGEDTWNVILKSKVVLAAAIEPLALD